MADLLGLRGLSTTTQNTLVAAYGNGFVNVLTGAGYGIPLTPGNNVEMDTFLSRIFFQNYVDTPLTTNGTSFSRLHVAKTPLSRYIKQWNSRMYLGYVKLNSYEYPSRVWYSNLPKNDVLQWGFEYGTNLVTLANNTLVTSAGAGFKTYGLKRGDAVFIFTGGAVGEYKIQDVIDDQHITLTEAPTVSSTGNTFWAGGNWFDVARDDGDYLTGLGENNNELLCFKRDSLHRYNVSSLIKVRNAVGTTSGRSIVNLHEMTYYFYGGNGLATGVYEFNGTDSVKKSSPIEKYIQGINTSYYSSIVGWREGELVRVFVGDISNTNYNISVSNAVLTYDYTTDTWSVDPISDIILASTDFRLLTNKQTYIGTNDAEIMVTPSGNDFNSSPIPFSFNTKTFYPEGTQYTNRFTKIEILSEGANGIRIQYRLHLAPFNTWEEFKGLGQINGEKTILEVPEGDNQASGIEFRFQGISTTEATALIKKLTIYYVKGSAVLL